MATGDVRRERGALVMLRRARSYIFGRNFLIGTASLMLLVISGFATWSGMADFIIGASGDGSDSVGRSIGGIAVTNDAVVVAIVVALTFLMWLALREAFGVERSLTERAVMFPLYLFLALWSIGFGYGFWWSLIAGQEATRTSMAAMREDARDAGNAIAARLDAVRIQLESVVSWSETQMAREEASGGSCGVASGAGRGPLYNARRSVKDGVASLRDQITTSWIQPVQLDLDQLRQSAARATDGASVADRQAEFEARAALIRETARRIAARSNEIGASTAATMLALANAVSIAPGEPGFSCYDPTLAQRLRQAADQSGQPAAVLLRQAAFNEGPAGVANAVKNLWLNIGSGLNALVFWASLGSIGAPSGDLEGMPITGRDLIALLATIGVDLGLFALTVLNPPPAVRHEIPFEARDQIRRAIDRAIATHPDIDIEWIRRHLVHHKRNSYLVIPNLFSARENDDEQLKALAMNKLAGVLDDLRVVRWPHGARYLFGFEPHGALMKLLNRQLGPSELEKLKGEETGESSTDLSAIRRQMLEKARDAGRGDDVKAIEERLAAAPLRNHGLFSKAEVALQSAGWSQRAQSDVEIFVLVDTEGLTPLLEVLNDYKASASEGASRSQQTDA
ncbi:MAG: hypothetical protein ACFCUN_03405 [Hyphomicrobiaceae bacterium]